MNIVLSPLAAVPLHRFLAVNCDVRVVLRRHTTDEIELDKWTFSQRVRLEDSEERASKKTEVNPGRDEEEYVAVASKADQNLI